MKKSDHYLQLGAISLLSHVAQGAAFVLLFAALGGTGSTSSFTFASPAGLALGAAYVASLSFLLGWGLRPKNAIDKKLCWNTAMALYALNLASLLAVPVPFSSGSILAMLWQLPMAPAMTAVNRLSGDSTALQYVLFALLAAVEPMCLTLGLLRKDKKPANAEKNGDPAASSAGAGAAIINEENNTDA